MVVELSIANGEGIVTGGVVTDKGTFNERDVVLEDVVSGLSAEDVSIDDVLSLLFFPSTSF